MYINKNDNSSFNFRAPLGMPDSSINEVLFPVPDIRADVDTSAAVDIKQMVTHLDLGELAANAELDLNISNQVTAGAILHIKVKSDGTARDVVFGDGVTSPDLEGVISKTKVQGFLYNGTVFLPMGAALQID
jgi:hypothetical protein